MCKPFLLVAMLLGALTLGAQSSNKNPLLDSKFWSNKPTRTLVIAEVECGHDPTESNSRTMDATTLAILQGADLDVIDYLLSHEGNSVAKETHHYRTYLHWAASMGNIPLVKMLIGRGASIKALDEHGNTPLQYALSSGQASKELIETFREAGQDLTERNSSGATLMMLAITSDRDLSLAQRLTTYGLKLSDTDAQGATLLDYAARNINIDQMKRLIAQGLRPSERTLIMAAQGARRSANSLPAYRYLIEELKLDPKTKTSDGSTLLHLVVSKPKQVEVVDYLLARGVQPSANAEGDTPLLLASAGSDTLLISRLLPISDLRHANSKGETALTLAVRRGTPEVVATLLDHGAEVSVRDIQGRNLYYHLVQGYREPMGTGRDDFALKLRMLMEHGLSPLELQPDGSSLLHYAASRGSVAMLGAVQDLGLNIDQLNDEGLAPLHRAALTAKSTELLDALVRLGADRSLKTDLGETAYDLALENSYLREAGVSLEFLRP